MVVLTSANKTRVLQRLTLDNTRYSPRTHLGRAIGFDSMSCGTLDSARYIFIGSAFSAVALGSGNPGTLTFWSLISLARFLSASFMKGFSQAGQQK
jgi:hypothetical protein